MSCSGVVVIGKMCLVRRTWTGLHLYHMFSIRPNVRAFHSAVLFATSYNIPCIGSFCHRLMVVLPPSLLYQRCTILFPLLPQGRRCSLITRSVSEGCNLGGRFFDYDHKKDLFMIPLFRLFVRVPLLRFPSSQKSLESMSPKYPSKKLCFHEFPLS